MSQEDWEPALSAVQLIESAQREMLQALELHLRGDEWRIPVHLGIALEHAAKAFLVNRHPSYVVELKQSAFPTLMRLLGDPAGDGTPTRTIGASESLLRLTRFVKLDDRPILDSIIDLRNGVLHSALIDAADTGQQLRASIHALMKILSSFDSGFQDDPLEFFKYSRNNKRQYVTSLLKQREPTAQFADRLVELARTKYQGSLYDTSLKERVNFEAFEALEPGQHGHIFIDKALCPACKNPVKVIGYVTILGNAPDSPSHERFGPEKGVYVSNAGWRAAWTPQELRCHICGLFLYSSKLVEAAQAAFPRDLSRAEWSLGNLDPAQE